MERKGLDFENVGTKVKDEMGGERGSHCGRPDKGRVFEMIRKEEIGKFWKRREEETLEEIRGKETQKRKERKDFMHI